MLATYQLNIPPPPIIKVEYLAMSSHDFRNNWLRELDVLILENLEAPEMTIALLAKEMSISEPQFYRRVKQWTGKSPNIYIREIRLKKAKLLLESGDAKKVKEVAYQVGFLKVEYFSKLYFERYGIRPSEIIYGK